LDEVELVEDMHNVAGFILLFWLALQIVFGITARQIQVPISVSPSAVIIFKRIHRIMSYGILLIAMFNLLNRRYVDYNWHIYLAIQIV